MYGDVAAAYCVGDAVGTDVAESEGDGGDVGVVPASCSVDDVVTAV